MSSGFDKARQALKMFDTTIHGLESIQELTKVGGDKAHDALVLVDAIVTALLDGFNAKTTPETTHFEIQAIRERFASNDAAIDEKAKEKFSGEFGEGGK